MPPYKPVGDRLIDLSFPDPNSGCWYWCGSIDLCGYGKLGVKGGETLAHRVSYKHFIGPVPHGYDVDHLCRNRSCVNPRHLEAVPHAENVRRSDHKSNHRNSRKTHCKHGHEFTEENTAVEKWRGLTMRKCRTCRADRARKRRAAFYGIEVRLT